MISSTGAAGAYVDLPPDELRRRAAAAVAELADCRLCPRDCGVDRLAGKWSACKTGRQAVVCSAFPHMGEESCLRGRLGSGTIFFGHCNLRCVFCQNADISQGLRPGPGEVGMTTSGLARLMLALQRRGVHNINWVSPAHVVPQALEALAVAAEGGLVLPVVYNTNGYDSLRSLELLDGVVDVYMPDLKTVSPSVAGRLLRAGDYATAATAAIREMHRQVGDLVIADGVARRGVLLRHLVLPGMVEETRAVLEWVARALGPGTYVNLMDQYRPANRVGGGAYAEIDRRLTRREFDEAVAIALDLGLERLDHLVG